MQRINLYQDHLKRRTDAFATRRLALMLVLMGVVLIAISGFQHWRAGAVEARAEAAATERESVRERLDALQARMADQPDESERRQRLREELAAKRALLDYLSNGPFGAGAGFSGVLDGLAQQVVEGVWLTRLELAGGGARMRIEGHALDPQHVPALIGALGEAPAFAGRNFRRLAIERPEEDDWRLNFVLASGPGQADS